MTEGTSIPFNRSEHAREEIVIGVVGPMGTDMHTVEALLKELLEKDYGYQCDVVKISEGIASLPAYSKLDRRQAFDYYNRMIEGGNLICERLKDKAALANVAVEQIFKCRNQPSQKRRAFIIHSLKRPQEVARLREIYGDMFYAVAVFADEQTRESRLARKINTGSGRPSHHDGLVSAQSLIRTDEREETEWGQKVSDTFAQADYFVRGDEESGLKNALERFLTLVFAKPFESPTESEVAMMNAYAAAFRSVDLSRQIGAAIVTRDGRILTTGCNEVPSPGGGQYWSSNPDDARDFKLNQDMNDLMKRDAIVDLLHHIDAVIMPEFLADGVDALYEKLNQANCFAGTRVDALIEFGRVSHAEMSALNGALLEQITTLDTDLYCTTFPCHMCARLIINAGIRNVFYIEPYPKSAAVELYGKSEIRVNPTLLPDEYKKRLSAAYVTDKRTYFLPFEGVAPRRYAQLFAKGKRKNNDGTPKDFHPAKAKPQRTPTLIAMHLAAEQFVAESIAGCLVELRTTPVSPY